MRKVTQQYKMNSIGRGRHFVCGVDDKQLASGGIFGIIRSELALARSGIASLWGSVSRLPDWVSSLLEITAATCTDKYRTVFPTQ